MSGSIHATAIVAPDAIICEDVEIGPYCFIGPHTLIEPGTRLGRGCIVRWCTSSNTARRQAMRRAGTTVIIEDVAFPVPQLAEATLALR